MRRLLCKALDIFSIIIERDLVKIRNKINILEDIELICSQQFQTVDRSPHDCVSIRKNLIDMGLRILFIIFFARFLALLSWPPPNFLQIPFIIFSMRFLALLKGLIWLSFFLWTIARLEGELFSDNFRSTYYLMKLVIGLIPKKLLLSFSLLFQNLHQTCNYSK